MGTNHARVVAEHSASDLSHVVDTDPSRLRALGERYGCLTSVNLTEAIIEGTDIAVIASPTALHSQMATPFLQVGCTVLLEKPFTGRAVLAEHLINLARQNRSILAIGMVERFNASVAEALTVEEPLHFASIRSSAYSRAIPDSVVSDLMIHDIDTACWLAGGLYPSSISAAGGIVWSNSPDFCSATLSFNTGLIASLYASRVGQHKRRELTVTTRRSELRADMLRQDVAVSRMSKADYVSEHGVRYRESIINELPFLDVRTEPLVRQWDNVLSAHLSRADPIAPGSDVIRAVQCCEDIDRILSAQLGI